MRKIRLFTLCLLCMFGFNLKAQESANVAYQDPNVRFTVITDGVLRLEYAPDGQFVNDRSFVAIKRQYPKVDYKVSKGSLITIKTKEFTLKYKKGSGPFTDKNLSIVSSKGVLPFKWVPGMKNNENLKGTTRTLDGWNGDYYVYEKRKGELEDGLLSRNGWTLIDDSKSYLFDNSDFAWIKERPQNGGQDFYFMGYGHNYKKALKDFTVFSGKVPLPPRYAFGYWWSRYWDYSDKEIRDLRNNFKNYDIPIDVIVLDMDWHYSDGKRGTWTGYNWNTHLLPSAQGVINYLHQSGVKTTMNIHPADGVFPYDPGFKEMVKQLDLDTATTKNIPYEGTNKKFMGAFFGIMLRQYENMGVDFWWYDWQQFLNDKKFKDLSNTWWLNYYAFHDIDLHHSARPMIYHRWGGLGNHRYPIGFSGDSYVTWNMLDYQPYFSSTASNVLYGYWGHDLGGHQMAGGTFDPELYARWLQFGVFTPIFRTHSSKNALLRKEPWMFTNDYTSVLRNAVQERYKLIPYIYTMARKTYDDAISICRPMYYDYPDNQEAYDMKNEYMFGDNLLISPITRPMIQGISNNKVWLPAGTDWYETATGTLLKGGQSLIRKFNLNEFPVYVKAGSILPLYEKVNNAQSNSDSITVTVFPGANKGQFIWYEDNGLNKEYAKEYATTLLSQEHKGQNLTVRIGARKGNYPDMPNERKFRIKVVASTYPNSVTVNGTPARYNYNGEELSLLIDVPQTSCSEEKTVVVNYPADTPIITDGLLGQMHHAEIAVSDLKDRMNGFIPSDELADLESLGSALTYFPEQMKARVENFRNNYNQLDSILKRNDVNDENSIAFLRHMMMYEDKALITSPEQFSSNAQSKTDNSDFKNLLDGNMTTLFHSLWKKDFCSPQTSGLGYHNLQVKLNNPVQKFYFTYRGRSDAKWHDNPNDIVIYATNDDALGSQTDSKTSDKWKLIQEINSGFPSNVSAPVYTSPNIDMGAPYKYIRFVVKSTTMVGTDKDRIFPSPEITGVVFNLSEFQIYQTVLTKK
ncbi:MAG: TIM-barrel domain-containing protein [Bacteroidaceae bacterium]|nr:glycoside hydrolase family 31 protein [Bacteroidaceae bacterium]